ncbi:MAG TPA: molybdopterin adenylyltransferase [Alkalispirochaeta sp.]|nr:molybdopterin adenylyltransferase [Alkalispirochaeta sp.]
MTYHARPTPVPIGILTVSDRAHAGTYEDRGGPAAQQWLSEVLTTPWHAEYCLVPDDQERIESAMKDLVDTRGCALVCVTGGTGPSPRDVTPEAVAAVCHRMLPGFGEEMRRASLKVVPTAILSRQEAGLRGTSLIIALPGNPGAISDCLEAVFAAVPYAIELAGGPILETDPARIAVFRPRHAQPKRPLP